MVSGASAWVWTVRPQLDRTQLFELMRRTARDIAPAGRDADTGFGLLDIPRALSVAAPAPDPFEPNESLEQVAPDGALPDANPPLTSLARQRADLAARLDALDDPRDIYRVWAPARRRTVVTAESRRNVRVRLLQTDLGARVARTRARFTLTVTNASSTGRFAYVSVYLPLEPTVHPAEYVLSVRTRGG
jgi:hypothetical protein